MTDRRVSPKKKRPSGRKARNRAPQSSIDRMRANLDVVIERNREVLRALA